MRDLPLTVAHHWDSPEGREMAQEYAAIERRKLPHPGLSDFALANAVFLVGRDDLRLIGFQTAAKERIRWLSVQLAIANVENEKLKRACEGINPEAVPDMLAALAFIATHADIRSKDDSKTFARVNGGGRYILAQGETAPFTPQTCRALIDAGFAEYVDMNGKKAVRFRLTSKGMQS